jgi:acetyl-CoA C-acetyltransferase
LAAVPAPELGAKAIASALDRAKVAPEAVEEVFMGCVLPAGVGQAPARQASLGAGIPTSAGCTTVNKVCGSGMKAIMLAHDVLALGDNEVMVAGGMENMSRAPYILDRARGGYRLGHGKVVDHMFLDGLEDAYDRGRLMGTYAEDTAERYQFTRDQQDAFAIESLERASGAVKSGAFARETAAVTVTSRRGDTVVECDEQPLRLRAEKIPGLKPAFRSDGTVTAANSSSISDGGAALVLTRRSKAESEGMLPQATIVGHASHAHAPEWFTTAPVGAIEKLLSKVGWAASDVDLFEINEAFAVVTMAAMRELDLPHDKVNIKGGACALGHPIGCSGARILVTLLAAMEQRDVKRGIAALCIGGGEATAVAVERPL